MARRERGTVSGSNHGDGVERVTSTAAAHVADGFAEAPAARRLPSAGELDDAGFGSGSGGIPLYSPGIGRGSPRPRQHRSARTALSPRAPPSRAAGYQDGAGEGDRDPRGRPAASPGMLRSCRANFTPAITDELLASASPQSRGRSASTPDGITAFRLAGLRGA
jgi:hypothetical protein